MEQAAALDISGLTVRYGDAVAIDDLSVATPRGQTVALLGANGAGKSTTVNAVLGLLRPTAGQVRVLGRDPADAVRAGSVGAMLQHGGLPSEARVGEVLDLVRRSFATAWPLEDLVVTAGIEGLRCAARPGPRAAVHWYAELGRDVVAGDLPVAGAVLALAATPPASAPSPWWSRAAGRCTRSWADPVVTVPPWT